MKFKHLIYVSIISTISFFMFQDNEYANYLKNIANISMGIYCISSLKFDNLEEKLF